MGSPYLSPDVYDTEQDKTFYVKSEKSNAGAYAFLARWGDVNTPIEVSDEEDVVKRFFVPDTNTNKYHLAAADYLTYASPLVLVRATGANSKNAVATEHAAKHENASDVRVLNTTAFEGFSVPTGLTFFGKCVGSLANGIKISIANKTAFSAWEYKDYFKFEPYDDLVSVAVVDTTGQITGIKNYVIETYELLSFEQGAKKYDNSTAYIKDVFQYQSKYVYAGDVKASILKTGKFETTLVGGVDDYTADFASALNTLKDDENIDFMRVFTSFYDKASVILASDVCKGREDAVCFRSPPLEAVFNTLTPEQNVVTYFDTTLNNQSTYAFNDDNWKQVHDKFNGVTVWIPCCSSSAGLHARSLRDSAAWYSPAGFNRGHLNNIIKLAWSANKSQRDRLYKSSINSIVSFKGEGVVLFGDKLAWKQPSAFDRINVRTLFIILRKAISQSSRKFLFENNTFLTRRLFSSATELYLTSIKNQGGLYDFRVICSENNNTPDVIDRNEFVGDIFLKPVKSINYIILRFTAVNTGASFEEFTQGSGDSTSTIGN